MSKKAKLTRWFSGNVKPVRKGWYECKLPMSNADTAQMDWWNGKAWCFDPNTAPFDAGQDTFQWRGFTAEQKGEV